MPFTQLLLLKISTVMLGMMMIGGATLLAAVALLTVRRFIPHHKLKLHNDVAGAMFATVGVLYAVLLAFVVVIVWQNFDRSNTNVHKEVNALVDLYRDAEAFSPEFKNVIRPLFIDYAEAVVKEEWKAMESGSASPQVTAVLTSMWSAYSNYLPVNETEKVFFSESVQKLNELGEFRRLRLMDANTGVHPLLWIVLIVGGIVTITFISFFGAENLNAQMIMAVLLAILVGLILFTILAMDYPFTGSVSVSSEIFKIVVTNLRRV